MLNHAERISEFVPPVSNGHHPAFDPTPAADPVAETPSELDQLREQVAALRDRIDLLQEERESLIAMVKRGARDVTKRLAADLLADLDKMVERTDKRLRALR